MFEIFSNLVSDIFTGKFGWRTPLAFVLQVILQIYVTSMLGLSSGCAFATGFFLVTVNLLIGFLIGMQVFEGMGGKELEAQGWANFLSGMLGGLPLTGVIVRSKVNIEAGAKTPLSAILHGFWLLAAVALLPQILELIPTCGLAALLVLTGWKLMDWKILATLKKFGWGEVVIFLTTSGLIVAQDLLTGVLVGIALALARVAFLLVTNCKVTLVQTGDNINLDIAGVASFVMKWKLASVLDKIPDGTRVTLTFNNLDFLDHASLEFLETWTTQHEQAGGQVVYDRDSLALKARQKVTKSDTAPAEIPQT